MKRDTFSCLFIISLSFIFISCNNNDITGSDGNNDQNGEITFESDHFVYHCSEEDRDIVEAGRDSLEANYQRILSDLQVTNVDRITVRAYASADRFYDEMVRDVGTLFRGATGYILNTGELRVLVSGITPTTFIHEFAHIVSMYVNASIPNNPRWLWEAVAIYEAREFIHPNTLGYMQTGDYPTLEELSAHYNQSAHQIYQLGYVIAEFIVEAWGREALIGLIMTNGNIQSVLRISEAEFEAQMYGFIAARYLGG